MLVLSRYRDERVMIGDDISVQVIDIRGDKVRLGVDAPPTVPVHREEVYRAINRVGSSREVKRELRLTPGQACDLAYSGVFNAYRQRKLQRLVHETAELATGTDDEVVTIPTHWHTVTDLDEFLDIYVNNGLGVDHYLNTGLIRFAGADHVA